jgi:hypothetical protein
MPQFKLTLKRGQRAQDVVRSAGTGIAGSDAIELNIDYHQHDQARPRADAPQLAQQISNKGFPQ